VDAAFEGDLDLLECDGCAWKVPGVVEDEGMEAKFEYPLECTPGAAIGADFGGGTMVSRDRDM
jgi:hypothetical protein